jgi:hypothetical protein
MSIYPTLGRDPNQQNLDGVATEMFRQVAKMKWINATGNNWNIMRLKKAINEEENEIKKEWR